MPLVPGVRPIVQISGRVFTDLSNLIVTYGSTDAANNRTTLRKQNGTSGYQIPVGKTYFIWAIQAYVRTAGAGDFIGLAYADNDVGVTTNTAFTNAVYPGGDADNSAVLPTNNAGTVISSDVYFGVVAQKYGAVYNPGSTAIFYARCWGYEV